jgi:uncharacterized protein YqjF (DUF2071 family)
MTFGFLDAAVRQAGAVDRTEHRPWPLPESPWTSAQSWVDLAFLHWPVDAGALRKLVPDSVELETYDETAWLGVVPFVLTGFRLRGLPPVPRYSTFPELNVRTYVTRHGKPGIWFFSLDAASRIFVEAAKMLYRLPYHLAQMSCRRRGDHVHYESGRDGAAFSGSYRGDGALFRAEPGSLDAFLTERYRVYTENGGRVYGADIHHLPWDLQRGEAQIDLNTMAPLSLADTPAHVLFSPRQDTVVWPLRELHAE